MAKAFAGDAGAALFCCYGGPVIPGYGPDCDLCTPDVHYLLCCSDCGRQWDEPPTPGDFVCPQCGAAASVTVADDETWQRDVLGVRPI